MTTLRKIKCPQCGHLTIYSLENPYRPFCSERCKIIDLGEWASESFKIPDSETSSDTSIIIDDDSDDENGSL